LITRARPFNPFPGLRPFDRDEDHLFFGREKEIDELLRRLRVTRFLSVIGTSGSGKSSLVRSGLIPALYSGAMVKAGASWRIAVLRPGENPIGQLAAALSHPEILETDPQTAGTTNVLLEATLRRSTRGLADAVQFAHLPPHDNVLVVVDQFEELFRFRNNRRIDNSRDESIAFVKLLLEAAADPDLPIYVVLTMRSDFIGDCMAYPGLSEAVNNGQYLVPRMQRDALRLAITGPVAVGGGTIAPRLVLRLLNDVGDDIDRLPVLQHALMRTWDHWMQHRQGDQPLDFADYEAIGTLREALSKHAEETYSEAGSASARQIAERMFKALTDTFSDPRGVRRPTSVRELAAMCEVDEAAVVGLVETFRQPGRSFLMPPTAVALTSSSIVDLSHESLMRCWDRLVHWAEEERTASAFYMRLSQAAQWRAQGVGGLWREPELDLGLQWKEKTLPTEAWARRYNDVFPVAMAFLSDSAAERDRLRAEAEESRQRKLRQARAAAAVFAVLSLGAGFLAYVASVQKDRAEANLTLAKRAVDQTLQSAEVNPALAGADTPQMAEFRRQLLERSRDLYREFVKENPGAPQLPADVAAAHVGLGHTYRMLNQPNDAAAEYQRAITRYQALVRAQPEFRRDLAAAFNWLAETFRPLSDRAADAKSAYDSALQIQAGIVKEPTPTTENVVELARTYYNRGILLGNVAEAGDASYRAAEADFREAIRLLEPVYQRDQTAAPHELARVYNNLAVLLALADNPPPETRQLYERAIAIDERLVREHPANREYKFELAAFHKNAADLMLRQREFDLAEQRGWRALDLLEELARPAPSLGVSLADAYTVNGTIAVSAGGDPNQSYSRALKELDAVIREPAAVAMPEFHWRFGEVLVSLAALLTVKPDDEVRRLLRRGIESYVTLAEVAAARGAAAEVQLIRDELRGLREKVAEPERRLIDSRIPDLKDR